MKILVFSDSHGNLFRVKKVLEVFTDVDMIFHLGDNVRDAIKIQELVHCPVKYVKGNTDLIEAPLEIMEDLCGKKFFLTHGHQYRIKSDLNNLYYAALEKEADVVLFGHSHVPYQETINEILFLNPGSIGDKRWQPKETYGIIEITENGLLEARILDAY